MKKVNQLVLAVALAASAPAASAAVSEEAFQALKDQVTQLTQALAEMEKQLADEKARAAAQPAPVAQADAKPQPAAASSWAEKIALNGDLRGRFENIDQENRDNERNRSRIRARAGITAKPQSGLEVGFGLSTSQDGDPVSSNQTIGSGGSRKDIYLDLAYFNWNAAEGLNLIGGKFKNNLYRPGKHALMWDSDFNPEGLGATYVNGPFFANVMGTWIESDSNASEAFGLGTQAGVNLALGDSAKLTIGAGYFNLNTAGKGGFYSVGDDAPRFYGNTTDDNDRYVYDYEIIEGFAELGFKLLGQPASLFVDYVKNSDAGEFDTGYAAGASIGAAKAKGTWEASYTWQDLEADAVFGLWTDSDFGGGGTDTAGHVVRGAYALSDKTNVAISYFFTKFGDNANDGDAVDYDRLQLDLNFKY